MGNPIDCFSTMQLLACLTIALPATASGFYWMQPRYNEFLYEYSIPSTESSHWTVSDEAYELKTRLPDLEPDSVTATLGAEGSKIQVVGERKIEGCSCRPSQVREISLPYRPRAEDISVAVDRDVLSLRLARRPKTETSTPLTVTVTRDKAAQEAPSTEVRPLRFVPHESATEDGPPSVEEKEKGLIDKFRSAALASVAVQAPSTKEAAATTAEGDAASSEAPRGTVDKSDDGRP